MSISTDTGLFLPQNAQNPPRIFCAFKTKNAYCQRNSRHNLVSKHALEQRKIFLKKDSNKFIDKLVEKKIYPEFNRKSIVDTYRKQQLNDIIETLYTTEPKIFTGLNVEQQKIFIRLLNMVMDSNERDSFFNIIHEVIELDDEELKELSEVLSYTSLSNMTKTIKLIEDRLKAVQQLKELVFNKHLMR